MNHELANVETVASPQLLIYPDRVEENLRRMIALAGGAERLCPHVKSHKLAELVRLQMKLGFRKFKCATLAEAEMLAEVGAPDVIFAYQPAGPRLERLIGLMRQYPGTRFSTVVDDVNMVRALSRAATATGLVVPLFVDLDVGMGRTGIPAGPGAFELYRFLAAQPGVAPGGLHVYDGHLCDADAAVRARRVDAALEPVLALRRDLVAAGLPVPRLVGCGSPTFPMFARRPEFECSPGTCVLWDGSYSTACRDMDFLHAALVLTRVVSKPGPNRLCLDLGHKAVASENPHPRVLLLDLPEARPVMHSEEHLVVETPRAGDIALGTPVYGVPWHVCPTVALYSEAVVVRQGRAAEAWPVARGRL